MVVMALMAVIFALSIAGIIILSNYNTADRAMEELILNLRDTQNRSISVTRDPVSGNLPATWGLHLNSTTGLEQIVLYDQGAGAVVDMASPSVANTNDKDTIKRMSSITINILNPDGSSLAANVPDVYLFNSAPYGKFYAAKYACTTTVELGYCFWDKSDVRPYDYVLTPKTPPAPNNDVYNGAKVEIKLNYKGQERKITIEANGDISGTF